MNNSTLEDLTIEEVEQIFGFDAGYSNHNLSPTDRLRLLGKAFSVQAFTALLKPLTLFFEVQKKNQ